LCQRAAGIVLLSFVLLVFLLLLFSRNDFCLCFCEDFRRPAEDGGHTHFLAHSEMLARLATTTIVGIKPVPSTLRLASSMAANSSALYSFAVR
jgi:hypothetical protein